MWQFMTNYNCKRAQVRPCRLAPRQERFILDPRNAGLIERLAQKPRTIPELVGAFGEHIMNAVVYMHDFGMIQYHISMPKPRKDGQVTACLMVSLRPEIYVF